METDKIAGLFKDEKISNRAWFKYSPYWHLFLILQLVTLAGAWLYLHNTVPQYESSASIIIKDNKRGIEDSKMIGELNHLDATKIVENEMEVLKSRVLMEEVVKNLGLYAPIFEVNKNQSQPAYVSSPVKVEAKNIDSIREADRVDFTYVPTTNTIMIDSKNYPLNLWVNTSYGVLRFNSTGLKPSPQSHWYFSLLYPKAVTLDLVNKLDVSSNKISSVVNLKIQDEIPKRSEDILTELIKAYNNASAKDKNILAANTLAFVEERLDLVSRDLNSIELQLQQYRARKGAIDISTQGKLFLENVSANDQKLSDVNIKMAVLSQIEQNLISNTYSSNLIPSTLGVDDPVLSSRLNKLYDLEMSHEKMKRTTGENNSQFISLVDQIEKTKQSILENVHNQQQSLEVSKRNLYSTNNSYGALLRVLPQQERNLVQINREQNIKSSIYNYLLQKREETALSNSSIPDSRIIDSPASSIQPVGPKGKPIYILAICLGFILAIIIVSAQQFFNRTVLFRHEIEELTSFPIIGEITLNKDKNQLAVGKGKTTFIAEQFRKLRTSLSSINIGSHCKKILITSTISGEGKSFLAVNLGLSLAMSGKKVVIVEFDLSNPSFALKMNFSPGKGVADYLKGDAEADEIIKAMASNENLFLIPAGKIPEDPSDLFTNSLVAKLFAYLETIFDYVLVDSAPVGLLSDGYVLSKHCDATLYVVRHKYTPKVMLERLDENNKINKLKNLVLVFNGVSSRGLGKRYGYGYGYGYVYLDTKVIGKNRKLMNTKFN